MSCCPDVRLREGRARPQLKYPSQALHPSGKYLPYISLWGPDIPFCWPMEEKNTVILFFPIFLTYIQAHWLLALHRTETIPCALSAETSWPAVNFKTHDSRSKWMRRLFRGPLGMKHSLLQAARIKYVFVYGWSELSQAFRVLLSAFLLQLVPFFLTWPCD